MTGTTALDLALQQLVTANAKPGVSLSTCTAVGQERLSQRFAYLALAFSTGKGGQLTWFAADNECSWTGVTCTNARMTQVIRQSQTMTGSLPADIGLWTNLLKFDVFTNSIAGTLPDTISRMTRLTYFDVYRNNLIGTLPVSLGAWRNLTFLGLGYNQLSGTVPATYTNWTSINFTEFYGNKFIGTMPPIGSNYCPKSTGIGEIGADCKAPAEIVCACCNRCCDVNGQNCVTL
jgi:hypothetical protein